MTDRNEPDGTAAPTAPDDTSGAAAAVSAATAPEPVALDYGRLAVAVPSGRCLRGTHDIDGNSGP